jgi:hypothetical protein
VTAARLAIWSILCVLLLGGTAIYLLDGPAMILDMVTTGGWLCL